MWEKNFAGNITGYILMCLFVKLQLLLEGIGSIC